MHPSTYINKLLMAGESSLHLVNVVTRKTVFDFAEVMKKADSTVSCMQQSPVVDIVALGFENGKIFITNLLYAEVL